MFCPNGHALTGWTDDERQELTELRASKETTDAEIKKLNLEKNQLRAKLDQVEAKAVELAGNLAKAKPAVKRNKAKK